MYSQNEIDEAVAAGAISAEMVTGFIDIAGPKRAAPHLLEGGFGEGPDATSPAAPRAHVPACRRPA